MKLETAITAKEEELKLLKDSPVTAASVRGEHKRYAIAAATQRGIIAELEKATGALPLGLPKGR